MGQTGLLVKNIQHGSGYEGDRNSVEMPVEIVEISAAGRLHPHFY